MRVGVAVDHAGVPLRDAVLAAVRDGGHELHDLGEHDDYPDVALRVGRAVAAGEVDRAILIAHPPRRSLPGPPAARHRGPRRASRSAPGGSRSSCRRR